MNHAKSIGRPKFRKSLSFRHDRASAIRIEKQAIAMDASETTPSHGMPGFHRKLCVRDTGSDSRIGNRKSTTARSSKWLGSWAWHLSSFASRGLHHFSAPTHVSRPRADKEAGCHSANMGKTLRILLVEDDTVDAMAVERAVRERQLDGRVKVVETAEAALERLGLASEGAREADLPELILTDLHLPLLSGLDLLERLKSDSRLRRIPVVFLSTSRERHHVFQAYDRGAAGYLVKPSSFKGFGDVLEQIVSYFTLSEVATACT